MKLCPQCESGFADDVSVCPAHGILLSEIRDLKPGMLIRGIYRIKKKLGKGGMGSVYLAQHQLLNEPRALKFLSPELSGNEAFTSRFLREVRTLRLVRNRHVVNCGDPERAEDGSLFFSMEYVDGPTLREFLHAAPSPFDVKLALDITRGIAEGLGAAHAQGMVHRDIKPENILMAGEGESWLPKIADFGIVATKVNSKRTRTGSMLLTMAYAAPEQWLGARAADLDGRTDLYALGGVLFEMLTGRTAFDAENYHGWAQKHMHALPPAPSSLRPDLEQWSGLDRLVLRLLAKERDDRPRDVAAVLAVLSAVASDAALPSPQAAPNPATMRSHSDHAERESNRFMPARWEGVPAFRFALRSAGGASVRRGRVITGPQPVPQRTSGEYAVLDRSTWRGAESRTSGAYQTLGRTTRARQARCSTGGEARAQKPARNRTQLWTAAFLLFACMALATEYFYAPRVKFLALQSQTGPILSVAFSFNGQTLASASRDDTIQFWRMSTDKPLNTLLDDVNALAFSPDGSTLAAANWDRNVQLWSAATGQLLDTMAGHTGAVLCVAFSPDGHILASGSSDKTVRLWDVSTGKPLAVLRGHTAEVRAVAFSSDGRTLATGSADTSIKLWNPASGRLLRTLTGHSRAVNALAFRPDGRALASASDDRTILIWDTAIAKVLRVLRGHTGPVRAVAFSPDSRILASGSDDTTVRLWNAAAGTPLTMLAGHTSAVDSLAFNPNGLILASGSADKTIRLWNLTSARF